MNDDAAARRIAVLFVLSILAGLGLAVVYVSGGQPQVEGALLAVSLGGIGTGLILFAKHLIPAETVVGDRQPHGSGADETAAEDDVERGEELLARRPFLIKLLVAAGAAFGLAAVFPIRSLGPDPGRALFETDWREGLRLVDSENRPVKVGDLEVGGVATVFPEGHTRSKDAPTLLIRVEPGRLRVIPGRETWSPDNLVAYSKICTHAGCPVGLYRTETHQLYCPCHQSTFDVLDGARPTFGPASRPLPQLPIAVDPQGFLVARGDFPEPVGPDFWNKP